MLKWPETWRSRRIVFLSLSKKNQKKTKQIIPQGMQTPQIIMTRYLFKPENSHHKSLKTSQEVTSCGFSGIQIFLPSSLRPVHGSVLCRYQPWCFFLIVSQNGTAKQPYTCLPGHMLFKIIQNISTNTVNIHSLCCVHPCLTWKAAPEPHWFPN